MPHQFHSSDSFVFKTDRPWPNARLKVAAIVGHTTENSVRLWLRTGMLGEYSLFLFSYEEMLGRHAGEVTLKSILGVVPLPLKNVKTALQGARQKDFQIENYDADTTRVLDLNGLQPGTGYGYVLYSHGQERIILGHNRLRWFRTLPSVSEQRPFQFAVFSCHMPYAENGLFTKRTETTNLEMWDFLGETLKRHRSEVDLIIAGGDQCYSDGVETLNIWRHLDKVMRKENGELLPDKEAMLSWYRDIYRGYWGFESIQRVFDGFPTYMIWDDHEIGDGWGSHYFRKDQVWRQDGLRQLLPNYEKRGLARDEGIELVKRMFHAARQVYTEYQHSHNPPTKNGVFDYSFRRGGCAFYVLDGRGQRDIARKSYRILGRAQFQRFSGWAKRLTPAETPFLFVVSAVPILHTQTAVVQADKMTGSLGDDLRDSWEHKLHDEERKALMEVLFDVAGRGIKVSILSGDVHISAVFSLEDENGNRIYQLTSSAITYNLTRIQSWALRKGAADDGKTDEGYHFKRLALYAESSYGLVSVNPKTGEVWFKLYGNQRLETPPDEKGRDIPLLHSLAKIECTKNCSVA